MNPNNERRLFGRLWNPISGPFCNYDDPNVIALLSPPLASTLDFISLPSLSYLPLVLVDLYQLLCDIPSTGSSHFRLPNLQL